MFPSEWTTPRLIRPQIVRSIGLAGVLLGSSLGCGGGGPSYPQPVPVAGKVTLAGKPLESGKLHFVPVDAKKSLRGLAKVESGGAFVAQTSQGKKGLTPGEYTIFIEPDAPGGEAKLKAVSIPDKYLSPTSPIKTKIEKPESDLEIDFP